MNVPMYRNWFDSHAFWQDRRAVVNGGNSLFNSFTFRKWEKPTERSVE